MIPLCSRFDSVLFTPKMFRIASYGDYSRSPGGIRENKHRPTTIFTMKQTDARITELMARLAELDRGRAEIVAEISTLRSVQSEGTAAI